MSVPVSVYASVRTCVCVLWWVQIEPYQDELLKIVLWVDFGVACFNVDGGGGILDSGIRLSVCLSVHLSHLCPEDVFQTTNTVCSKIWYDGASS